MTNAFIDRLWDEDIIPTLSDYIRIPNKSPMFDPEWESRGAMTKAMARSTQINSGAAASGAVRWTP